MKKAVVLNLGFVANQAVPNCIIVAKLAIWNYDQKPIIWHLNHPDISYNRTGWLGIKHQLTAYYWHLNMKQLATGFNGNTVLLQGDRLVTLSVLQTCRSCTTTTGVTGNGKSDQSSDGEGVVLTSPGFHHHFIKIACTATAVSLRTTGLWIVHWAAVTLLLF